jgi:hypothetical protein
MIFTLSDGRSFDTKDVREVSTIRDYGQEKSTIELSKLAFTVYFKTGKSIQIADFYHYSDWSAAKKRLSEVREQIVLLKDAEATPKVTK